MGRINVEHRREGDIHRVLAEFYGEAIPATALLLDDHVTARRIPLRMPGGEVRIANLGEAAKEFGADLAECRRYLHHLHATGRLCIDPDGTVDLSVTHLRLEPQRRRVCW